MSVQAQSWYRRQTRDFPIVTYSLVAFNIAIYIATQFADPAEMFDRHGLVPGRLSLHAMFTCAFLHTDSFHLALNMAFLLVFGRSVELAMGALEYLIFYVGSGFAASVAHVAIVNAFMPSDFYLIPVVGASGAISGILGVFTIRFFRRRFRVWRYAIPAAPILLFWLIGNGVMGILSLYHDSYRLLHVTVKFRDVGYWSHFGGFVFGLLAATLTDLAKQGQKEYVIDSTRNALRRGTLLEVVSKFEWLLQSDPSDAFAAAELGRTWALLGDKEQSVAWYKQAIERYLAHKDFRTAAARFDEMRHFWPDAMFDTETHFRIACLLEEGGEYQQAADAYSQLYCYRPECREAEMALLKSGHIEVSQLDRPELAAALLERFIELYPESQWRPFAEQSLAQARAAVEERKGG